MKKLCLTFFWTTLFITAWSRSSATLYPLYAASSESQILLEVVNSELTILSVTSTPLSNGAVITWTTNNNSSSKVDYGLTSSYGSSTPETDTSPRVTNHSVSLSNLVSCTTYHYRVRSKDSANNEAVGSDNTFTTTGCTGSASVESQTSSSITATSGGSVSLLSDSKGITLTVPAAFAQLDANFQIKQLDKTAVNSVTSVPAGYLGIGSYYYDLKALTDVSTSLSSFNKPVTVSIVYGASDVSGINESSLKIYRWDGSNWNQLSNCSVNTSTKTVSCTTTVFSVFGLFGQPSDSLDLSSSLSLSTSAPGCGDQPPGPKAPWLYGAIAQDSTSILLYFTEADNPVDKYVLAYGTSSGNYQYGVKNMGVNLRGQMTYLVSSLAPNTTYYFRVRAGNGCAVGNWSNEISAKTKRLISFNQLKITEFELEPQPKEPYSAKAPASEETQLQQGYDVRISVVDTNKKPVEGAKITLYSEPIAKYTDKNGIVVFENVSAGEHKIVVEHKGQIGESRVVLSGQVETFDFRITLEPTNPFLQPEVVAVIATLALLIVVMGVLLLRKRERGR
jgi:hypothetical protein